MLADAGGGSIRFIPSLVTKMQRTAKPKGEAFLALLWPVSSQLMAFCRKLAGKTEGEDLYAETVEKAFRCFEQFQGERPFIRWLRRIAIRTFLEWKRKKTLPEADGADVEATWIRCDMHSDLYVEALLFVLDSNEREAVLLVAEGLSHEMAADTLGVSAGTIRNRLRSAAAKLLRSQELDPAQLKGRRRYEALKAKSSPERDAPASRNDICRRARPELLSKP